MGRNIRTEAIVDGILKFLLAGGTISVSLIIPNSIIVLNKPLKQAFKQLDKRQQQREIKRVLNYMKSRKLISTADYEHGVTITPEGRKRAKKVNLSTLQIEQPIKWDRHWRIIFFDIPEAKRNARIAFSSRLRQLGFKPLQLSTWIHPFPCRKEIETLTIALGIERYVTYIETSYIDNPAPLKKQFKHLISYK